MNLWSITFAFRLGLGFHALNNEGSDGSNLMQPRRIDVGDITYDGISGEMIRHQILENFVNACRRDGVNNLPLSEGLHPDRGPIGIRAAAHKLDPSKELSNENLFPSVRRAIELCAVLDVGGYLAAWNEAGGAGKKYVAEQAYVDRECAKYKDADTVKRDSCFDVGWLISEEPQDLTVTQHSAFRSTVAMNSRYGQTMRSNVYGGVIRADLHRIGTDDYWYLQHGKDRLAIDAVEQGKRQTALVDSIVNFIAAPTGAKVAGWAPHVFLTQGVILLMSSRTAPFVSPIAVTLGGGSDKPIQQNPGYVDATMKLANKQDAWAWSFTDTGSLLAAGAAATKQLADVSAKEAPASV